MEPEEIVVRDPSYAGMTSGTPSRIPIPSRIPRLLEPPRKRRRLFWQERLAFLGEHLPGMREAVMPRVSRFRLRSAIPVPQFDLGSSCMMLDGIDSAYQDGIPGLKGP